MSNKNKFDPKKETEKRYQESKNRYTGIENELLNDYRTERGKNEELYKSLLGMYGGIAGDDNAYKGYLDFSKTGGLTPEDISRMLGGGVFEEFSKTGGVTDADKFNIRARTASTTPSFFSALKDNLATQRNAQGGYAPGYVTQNRRLARDAARGTADAVRDTELGISDRVREGRQWGAGSLAGAGGNIAGMRTGNQLAGLGGLNSSNALKLNAAGGMSNLYSATPSSMAYMTNLLRTMGMSDQLINDLLGLRASQQGPSFWDKLLGAGLTYGPMLLGGGSKKRTGVTTGDPDWASGAFGGG